MRELNLDEVKEMQLKVLDFFSEYCKKHNLRYSAYLGTLLGAIRHQGYIPWDDDIDLMMPRHDYNLLVNNFFDVDNKFGLASIENDSKYYLPFAKIYLKGTLFIEDIDIKYENLGVNIDIFPVDFNNNSFISSLSLNLVYILKKFALLKLLKYRSGRSAIKNKIVLISKLILKLIKLNWIIKSINYLATSRFKIDSNYRCKVGIYNNRELYSSDLFDNIISVRFEKTKTECINNFDDVLKRLYGDYMVLPPISKRISTHNFKAYIL